MKRGNEERGKVRVKRKGTREERGGEMIMAKKNREMKRDEF